MSKFIQEFHCLFQDLSHLSDEEIKERIFKRAATEIAALMMKDIHDFGDPKKVKKQKKILLDLIGKIIHIGLLYYEEEEETFIKNYFNLDALDQALDQILFAETKEEGLNCLI